MVGCGSYVLLGLQLAHFWNRAFVTRFSELTYVTAHVGSNPEEEWVANTTQCTRPPEPKAHCFGHTWGEDESRILSLDMSELPSRASVYFGMRSILACGLFWHAAKCPPKSHVCRHVCKHASRHVCRHVCRHVYPHVYPHVYSASFVSTFVRSVRDVAVSPDRPCSL